MTDVRQTTKIDRIDDALRALGKRLVVLQAAWQPPPAKPRNAVRRVLTPNRQRTLATTPSFQIL